MNRKNLLAVLMTGIMLATIFSVMSVNAGINPVNSYSKVTETDKLTEVTVTCVAYGKDPMHGEPSPYVTVQIFDEDGNLRGSDNTGADNHNVVFNLPYSAGGYNIKCTSDRYRTAWEYIGFLPDTKTVHATIWLNTKSHSFPVTFQSLIQKVFVRLRGVMN